MRERYYWPEALKRRSNGLTDLWPEYLSFFFPGGHIVGLVLRTEPTSWPPRKEEAGFAVEAKPGFWRLSATRRSPEPGFSLRQRMAGLAS